MVGIKCAVPNCPFTAEDDDKDTMIAILSNHNLIHLGTNQAAVPCHKTERLQRPVVTLDMPEVDWSAFIERWERYKRNWELTTRGQIVDQLIACCDDQLQLVLLKENPSIDNDEEAAVLTAMKNIAVVKVAVLVRRNRLAAMRQQHGQKFREFHADVRASAMTCAANTK